MKTNTYPLFGITELFINDLLTIINSKLMMTTKILATVIFRRNGKFAHNAEMIKKKLDLEVEILSLFYLQLRPEIRRSVSITVLEQKFSAKISLLTRTVSAPILVRAIKNGKKNQVYFDEQ